MTSQTNLRLAEQFLARLGDGASAEEIASLCTPNLDWKIPGDTGVLPWVGHKTGSSAIADFVRDTQRMIQRDSLEIHEVLASEQRAVILGHLRSRVAATSKLIDSEFAIVLTFAGEKIASLLMLEDSFAVSNAAQG